MGDSWFPCPVCRGTMIPGAQMVYPRPVNQPGPGKIWDLSNGTPQLVPCERCQGTGKLPDLRGRGDRRLSSDRRGGTAKHATG